MPKDHEPEKIPASDMSVEDIFFKIRGSMGHTWPVGTFNQGEPPDKNIIEGQARPIPQKPQSSFDEKHAEVTHG